jgi:hypothetical protein
MPANNSIEGISSPESFTNQPVNRILIRLADAGVISAPLERQRDEFP